MSIPLRYQSDDGWCAVELRARVRATTVRADVATAVEVSDAAERVIEECVVRTSAGGSVTGFSGFSFFSFFQGGGFFHFLVLFPSFTFGWCGFFSAWFSFSRLGVPVMI